MHEFHDLINLLINSQVMKSTCFICYKLGDQNMMDAYENIHIENQWLSTTISLKALMKYVFPMQEIILSQACHLCVDLLISTYKKLRRKEYIEECLNILIKKINNKLHMNILTSDQKLYIETELTNLNKKDNNVSDITAVNNDEDFTNLDNIEAKECCPICFKLLAVKQFKIHLRQHKQRKRKSYSCDLCDYRTKCKTTLDGHKNNKHFQQRPHHCSHCGKSFYTKSALTEHSKTHERTKNIICEICGDSFSHSKSLRDHLKLHSNDKTFECCVCNQRFVNRSRVNNHMQQKHGEKKEFCIICGKRFVLKKDLRRHVKLVHKQDCPNGSIEPNTGMYSKILHGL